MELWTGFAVICAYVIKGLCGFANTLVLSTMLSFGTSNINITPVELLVGYPSNIIVSWKERKSLNWKIWLPLVILVIAGSIPGAVILKSGNVTVIKIIFGFVVAGIGLELFLRERQNRRKKYSSAVMLSIGLLSGLLCGLFGIGALLAAYMGQKTESSKEFRGNLCIVFLAENTFRIILYSVTGILTAQMYKRALLLIPLMILGLLAGIGLSKVLDEKKIKTGVIILLILSGLSLIITNF
ncbi:hypothetical protein HNQ56_000592 [Anaerotaenia torta]|uniref:sulfite exporter TauE/SafE family protein n=1 Tax=Anaerotaenia torta TaxID=433293 RepID=UPI003D1E916F